MPYGFATAICSSIARMARNPTAPPSLSSGESPLPHQTPGPLWHVVITDKNRYHPPRLHRTWSGRNTRTDSSSTICRRTAQISTRSNGFGSLPGENAYTTDTSRYSARSSIPSRPNSRSGYAATLPCVAYAQSLRTPCLVTHKCGAVISKAQRRTEPALDSIRA